METKRALVIKTLAVAALVAASMPARAEHNERHDGGRGGWHGDIRHFERHDFPVWRSGRWYHGRHGDRLGWWWVSAGMWYFYPVPVYPYPDPYTPPVVVVQTPPSSAGTNVPPQPAASPPAQYWYFCAASNGYYPYVPSCPGGWKTVPAMPPDTAPSNVPAQ